MKEYDLRNAGTGCINNVALAILDILKRGEKSIKITTLAEDMPADILETVAKTYGYRLADVKEQNGTIVAVLEKMG